MHVPECVFNGVENPNEVVTGCDKIFLQWQRDVIAEALDDAEGMIADAAGFWVGYRYITDEAEPWTDPMQLRYGHIIGGGIEGLTEVIPSASDFTVDPALITVAQADFPGGESEIKIVETSSGLRINPTDVAETGVNYVISIPQCRLIEWDNLDGQTASIDYDAAFPAATWLKLADLTIYRSYLDTTSQATITYGPDCNCLYCGTACEGLSYTGCVYVIDPEISKVRIQMATYSSGSWGCEYPVYTGCYRGDKVEVSYKAGTLDEPGWRRTVISLANSMLDFQPCGCAAFDFRMNKDRHIPSVLTGERINCEFGLSDGAWYAWKWCQNHKHVPAFML